MPSLPATETDDETVSPLREPEQPVGAKRKQALKAGQSKCWFLGCSCTTGLEPIPKDRVADCAFLLGLEHGISADGTGERTLPPTHNKLCAQHRPTLPKERLIGAAVLLEVDSKLVRAVVTGPAPAESQGAASLRGVAAARAARAARPSRWRAEGSNGVVQDLEEADVWRRAKLLVAYDADRKAAADGKAKELATKVKTLQQRLRRAAEAAADEGEEGEEGEGEGDSTTAAPTPSQPGTRTVRIRVPVPRDWRPGEALDLEVPAGFVAHSLAKRVLVAAPPGTVAGALVKVDVALQIEPPLTPAPPTKQGKKAEQARNFIKERAAFYGLDYSPSPNPRNPTIAWPLREQLSFANLRPEYFELHERRGLFKKVFGFPDWDAAHLTFECIFEWAVPNTRSRHHEEAALLHPRFQFLAACWRMRQHKDLDELASFFGVSQQAMCDYVIRWIKRMGRFAKENLVVEPKDWASVIELSPQVFRDCGLGSVVLIGDCTDLLTETSRESIMTSNLLRSDKSKHSAAMGLTWVTPNGYIAIATDLFMGRSSEHAACKACCEALGRIPGKYALMYDRGVSKLRVHLPNLNQVITPCFLRKAKRFTVEQGIRNRGVTCCRYIVEVPFSNMKAWQFLAGIVPEEDKHLLNYVWWWSIGFHNLCCEVLQPPAGV